jgi:hypothetical protein
MSQFEKDLRMYAKNDLRSAEEWLTCSRKVHEGATPRTNVTCRGRVFELFTRDQTRHCPSKHRQ